MPSPEDIEALSQRFTSIVSLSTPSEHASRGYDPRLLMERVSFKWLPVGKYNAPRLGQLIEIVDFVSSSRPALIHSLRGCGRSVAAAAAYIIAAEGLPYMAALSEVTRVRGCGLETAPQLLVLKAFSVVSRADKRAVAAAVKGDLGDAVVEYTALLSRELAPYLDKPPHRILEEALSGSSKLGTLAATLYRAIGYTLSDLALVRRSGGVLELRVQVWVERGAHPAAAPEARTNAVELEALAEGLQSYLSEAGISHVLELSLDVRRHNEPPWL